MAFGNCDRECDVDGRGTTDDGGGARTQIETPAEWPPKFTGAGDFDSSVYADDKQIYRRFLRLYGSCSMAFGYPPPYIGYCGAARFIIDAYVC